MKIVADFRDWPLKITCIAVDGNDIMIEVNGRWFEANELNRQDKKLRKVIEGLVK